MEPPHPPPPPSGSAQHAITVDASAPLAALRAQIEALCGVVAFRQRLLFGFPPKELGGGGSDGDSTVSLAALGLKTGETLILEENANAIAPSVIAAAPLPTQPSRSNSSSSSSSSSSLVDGNGTSNSGRIGVDGAMVRRVIDSDNSCLFNAFGYVHACDRRAATELRELIAGIVMSDPDTYSEAFLGQANESYCQFIMNPDRWGGAIELSILASNFNVEICAIDIQTCRPYFFGEGAGHPLRCFLLYSGIHYDAVALTHGNGGGNGSGQNSDEAADVTMFAADDDAAVARAVELANELRRTRQFTDAARFKLRCQQCRVGIVGQVEALDHAKATGHVQFDEY